VTVAALKLQAAGLINCARGHIFVLDRAGLEQRSCECYAVVRNEYARLLPYACGTVSPCAPAPAVQAASRPATGRLTRRDAVSVL
jgi:hypothetical protein